MSMPTPVVPNDRQSEQMLEGPEGCSCVLELWKPGWIASELESLVRTKVGAHVTVSSHARADWTRSGARLGASRVRIW